MQIQKKKCQYITSLLRLELTITKQQPVMELVYAEIPITDRHM